MPAKTEPATLAHRLVGFLGDRRDSREDFMNVGLSEARKAYWRDVKTIQARQGCTTVEAKAIYRNGNHRSNGHATAATPTIDELLAMACRKIDSIHAELTDLSNRTSALQDELAKWGAVREAISPVPATA